MEPALVSTIIPTYNGARFLGEALASVRAQTYRPQEIIIVDDGSSDCSVALSRATPGVTVIEQAHAGVAAARNRGVAAARGALIAFLDQDDHWLPNKLAIQTDYLRAHPAADGCFTMMDYYLEAGTPRPTWLKPEALVAPIPGYILGTLLIWRRALEGIGPFDSRWINASDYDWIFRAREAGIELPLLDDVLLRKRAHAANSSADAVTSRAELVGIVHASLRRRAKLGASGERARAD